MIHFSIFRPALEYGSEVHVDWCTNILECFKKSKFRVYRELKEDFNLKSTGIV